jgi:hypothetical protein
MKVINLTFVYYILYWSQDCWVGIATGYGTNVQGSVSGRVKIFLFAPRRQGLLCGPVSYPVFAGAL